MHPFCPDLRSLKSRRKTRLHSPKRRAKHWPWRRHRGPACGPERDGEPMAPQPSPSGQPVSLAVVPKPHSHPRHCHSKLPMQDLDTCSPQNSCRHFPTHTSCSGPKSGGRRPGFSLYRLILLQGTVGARVSSGVATEERPGLGQAPLLGKRSDAAQPGRGTSLIKPLSHTMQSKRAYKRACRRAMSSLQEGTMYRGKWHSKQALTNMQSLPPTPAVAPKVLRRQRSAPNRPVPTISVFCWNVGGLASHIFQELMAWLATNGTWDIIILQETHWGPTDDFSSGEWSCVHSSGHTAKEGPDKFAGLLIVISRKAFRNIATQEHVPGRLLQVRALHTKSQHTIDVQGIYQHVRRTTMNVSQNRRVRQGVWHALQQLLEIIPVRNKVVIGGDFNSTLHPVHPGVGPAVPRPDTHDNHDATLQQVLQDYELCAVNTWHARPHTTFFSTTTRSQLDYILVRQGDAGATAKQSAPLHRFPVTGDRLSNHVPVQTTLPLRPFWMQPTDRQAPPAFDRDALQHAIEHRSPQAQLLHQAVEARVQALPAQDSMHHMHGAINDILLQETSRAFPPQRREDRRVSADLGYRASASRTWALYRALKAPGPLMLANIWGAVAGPSAISASLPRAATAKSATQGGLSASFDKLRRPPHRATAVNSSKSLADWDPRKLELPLD